MLYAGLVIFAGLLDTVLEGVTRNTAWMLISPQNTLLFIIRAIFDGPPDNVALLGSAVAALVALLLACVLILERRVRAVDVVA
jgi:hypothetical protein